MFRRGVRHFATAAESAVAYNIKVGRAQGKVNGFVGGELQHVPPPRPHHTLARTPAVNAAAANPRWLTLCARSNRQHAHDPAEQTLGGDGM